MVGKKKRIAAMLLAFAVMLSMSFVTAPVSEAAVSTSLTASGATTFTSTNDANDQVKVTIVKGGFNVYCKHSDYFDGMDVRLIPYNGGEAAAKMEVSGATSNALAKGGSWTVNFDLVAGTASVPNGTYWVFVYKYNPDDLKSEYLPLMRGPVINIKDGTATLMTYAGIKSNNASVDKTVTSTSAFKKTDMSDMKYLLNKTRDINSSTESAYYKKVAGSIVSNGDSNYTKAKKLFAWVADNFYYDYIHTNATSFDDPYINLKNQQDGGSDDADVGLELVLHGAVQGLGGGNGGVADEG